MRQFRGTWLIDVLDWTGNLSGTFTAQQLPTNGGTFSWGISQLYVSGVLKRTGPPLEDDFNFDGTVNAANYVVWRKADGAPAGYATWRTYFGQSVAGDGVSASTNAAFPNPILGLVCVIRYTGGVEDDCHCWCALE